MSFEYFISNFIITIIIVGFNLFGFIIFEKRKRNNKKDLAHYEAIADEHLIKMYNLSSVHLGNIFYAILLSCCFEAKIYICIYVGLMMIKNIQARITFLQSSIDILQLKNGLIRMFVCDCNNYTKTTFIEQKIEYECKRFGTRTNRQNGILAKRKI